MALGTGQTKSGGKVVDIDGREVVGIESPGGGDPFAATVGDIGSTTDAEATGNGSVIALLKRLRTLLGGSLKVVHDGTGLGDGRKTVAAFGTAEPIAGSTACKWVIVSALTSNTQQVNVGASTVLAAAGTARGTPLLPGDSVTLLVSNLNQVFVDSRVNAEGVSFTYGT